MWPFKKRSSKSEPVQVEKPETPSEDVSEMASGGVYAHVVGFAPVEEKFQRAFDDMDENIATLRVFREKLETRKKRSRA